MPGSMKERKEETKLAASYERKFVFLTPQDKGYELVLGKPPKGHLEIERKKEKLNVKVFVENLKEMDYQVQLFDHEGKYACLGDLSVGANGKADEKFSTSSSNVKGSQLDLKDFEVIVIRALGEEYKREAPLVAWLKGKKGKAPIAISQGKSSSPVKAKEEPPEPEKEIKEEVKENKDFQEAQKQQDPAELEEMEQDQQEEKGEQPFAEERDQKEEEEREQQENPLEELLEEPLEEDTIEETTDKELTREEPLTIEAVPEPPIPEEEPSGEVQQKLEDNSPQQEMVELEEIYSDSKEDFSSKGEYVVDYEKPLSGEGHQSEDNGINLESPYFYINENLESLENTLTPYTPFTPGLKGHKWWKITGQEENLKGFYLFFNGSFVPITYPYMEYGNIGDIYVKKYNHRIFGMVFDEKYSKKYPTYYVYGIPGRMCIQDQPFQGNTGYLYWHPAQSHKRQRGVMGYWLLYVDTHSGTIAVPKRPTIPPIYRE